MTVPNMTTAPAEELIDAVMDVVRAFRDGRQLTPAVAALTNIWEKHPSEFATAIADKIKTPRDAQLAFRDALRTLCLRHYTVTTEAGLNATEAAQTVAEECMHMSAYFVANGSTWSADQFVNECRKMFEFHKNNPPPKTSTLN